MASIARALGHEIEEDYLRSLLERDDLRNGGSKPFYFCVKLLKAV